MSVMDELEAAFGILKKVGKAIVSDVPGEAAAALDELGEKIFGPQPKGACTKGVPCTLEDGHEPPCKPLRAVADAPPADPPADPPVEGSGG